MEHISDFIEVPSYSLSSILCHLVIDFYYLFQSSLYTSLPFFRGIKCLICCPSVVMFYFNCDLKLCQSYNYILKTDALYNLTKSKNLKDYNKTVGNYIKLVKQCFYFFFIQYVYTTIIHKEKTFFVFTISKNANTQQNSA